METYLIYKCTSPSGKSYIGQTKNLTRRLTEHKRSTSTCRAFHSAITKYELTNFTHEILMEGLSSEEANYWEPALILEHNTLSPNGYNLMTGGNNSTPSDETRAKRSVVRLGKPLPDEVRCNISNAKSGIPTTDVHKAKLQQTSANVAVNQYTITGTLLASFISAKDASRSTGVDNVQISRCCNGTYATAGGYIWEYSTPHTPPTSNTKPVVQLDDNKTVIQAFNSVTDAANYMNSSRGYISKACKSPTTKALGFFWSYSV
jgi:group I intron endonuclease